jgi:hypothetical protein
MQEGVISRVRRIIGHSHAKAVCTGAVNLDLSCGVAPTGLTLALISKVTSIRTRHLRPYWKEATSIA